MNSLQYFADPYDESNNFSVLSDRSKIDLRECEKRPATYELTWFRNVSVTPSR